MKKFKNSRWIVNIIGLPIMLYSIYSELLFPILVLLILLICSIEYVRLMRKINVKINLLIFLTSILLIYFNSQEAFYFTSNLKIYIFSLLVFLINEIFLKERIQTDNIIYSLLGITWLGVCMSGSLLLIREINQSGMVLTYLLFSSIWICDTFALVCGSKFGKKRILPKISPRKTWVGCIAGFIGAVSVVFIFNIINNKLSFDTSQIIAICLILGIIGQIGDFLESFLKRKANIKDSSNVLMGHGGFLDRFDSISFAAPILYLYLSSIKWVIL